MWKEFTALWIGDYDQDSIETNKILYGEDREIWPKTDTETPITIDMSKIIAFNPSTIGGSVRVCMIGGDSFMIKMDYEQFKEVVNA
jgi:hypothetical protein